jgi:oxygen-dependent protoporphyrinogen oxidase
VAIVGGGITGLAAAHALQGRRTANGRPIACTLIERDGRLGGKIRTVREGAFLVEGGPDSFLAQKAWATDLCRELGLGDALVPANPEQRRVYVVRNGKLLPFPAGFRLAVPTEFRPFMATRLISLPGKLRAGLDLVIPRRRETGDESLGGFLRRRLGREVAERLAGPVMSGIYTADPERLSMAASWPMFVELECRYGSLIRGMLAARRKQPPAAAPAAMFLSLQGGMEELASALASRLDAGVLTRTTVHAVTRDAAGFTLTLSDGHPAVQADVVVLAIPAYAAAELVAPWRPQLAAGLRAIRYVGTASVSLGYPRTAIGRQPLDGYGFLVPAREGRAIHACTWSSTKFPGRAPPESVLVRGFLGGDGHEDLLEKSDEELAAMVKAELASLLGLHGEPIARRVFRWPLGNPQYDVGHLDRVADLEAAAAETPGLILTGSAYRGVSVPDCIRQAGDAANQILATW